MSAIQNNVRGYASIWLRGLSTTRAHCFAVSRFPLRRSIVADNNVIVTT